MNNDSVAYPNRVALQFGFGRKSLHKIPARLMPVVQEVERAGGEIQAGAFKGHAQRLGHGKHRLDATVGPKTMELIVDAKGDVVSAAYPGKLKFHRPRGKSGPQVRRVLAQPICELVRIIDGMLREAKKELPRKH